MEINVTPLDKPEYIEDVRLKLHNDDGCTFYNLTLEQAMELISKLSLACATTVINKEAAVQEYLRQVTNDNATPSEKPVEVKEPKKRGRKKKPVPIPPISSDGTTSTNTFKTSYTR